MQYLLTHVRLKKSHRRKVHDKKYEDNHNDMLGSVLEKDIPESLDWREKGFITPENNQRSCGACYAFSIAHSVSGVCYIFS